MGIFSQLRDREDEPPEDGASTTEEGETTVTDAGKGRAAEEPGDAPEVADGPAPTALAAGTTELGGGRWSEAGTRRGRFSRRGFLGGTAAAGAAAAGYYLTSGAPFLRQAARIGQGGRQSGHSSLAVAQSSTPAVDPGYDLFIQVERDADLVLLDFYFYGFEVGTDGFGRTSLLPTGPDNYVIVRFPPQAIAEAVYWEVANPATQEFCDPSPILSAMSGQSQLSFQFGSSEWIPIPNQSYSDLLDWSGWPLQVTAPAQVPQSPVYNPFDGHYYYPYPQAPGPFDTFVEFPYCLYLAPSVFVPPSPGFTNGAFTTDVSNVVVPVQSAAGVVDVFTSAIIQTPYYPDETATQTGLVALWTNDFIGAYGAYGFQNVDVTPEAEIFYGTQVS